MQDRRQIESGTADDLEHIVHRRGVGEGFPQFVFLFLQRGDVVIDGHRPRIGQGDEAVFVDTPQEFPYGRAAVTDLLATEGACDAFFDGRMGQRLSTGFELPAQAGFGCGEPREGVAVAAHRGQIGVIGEAHAVVGIDIGDRVRQAQDDFPQDIGFLLWRRRRASGGGDVGANE